jgi:exodeoxyribonuclease X
MFIFLDTETTGNEEDDRLCQLAFKTDNEPAVNQLFNPGRPISIEAMSVHHITNDAVKDKPPFRHSVTWKKLRDIFESDGNILVAHNAVFDVSMLKKEGIIPQKQICTLKMARHLDKDGVIPKYNLQYLRYYLDLNIEANAHDALGDLLVLEALFQRIYKKALKEFGEEPTDKMIEISMNPILIRRMPFGKHKGMKMEEVPVDYLQWLSTTDLDEDLEYTVRHYLGF